MEALKKVREKTFLLLVLPETISQIPSWKIFFMYFTCAVQGRKYDLNPNPKLMHYLRCVRGLLISCSESLMFDIACINMTCTRAHICLQWPENINSNCRSLLIIHQKVHSCNIPIFQQTKMLQWPVRWLHLLLNPKHDRFIAAQLNVFQGIRH